MDKVLNEFIAERLFGLVRQKDFGEWAKHDWYKKGEYLDGEKESDEIDNWAFSSGYCNGPLFKRCYHSFCMHCSDDYKKELGEGPCVIHAPKYTDDVKSVLDKFCKKYPLATIAIRNFGKEFRAAVEIDNTAFIGADESVGKAVCTAIKKFMEFKGA